MGIGGKFDIKTVRRRHWMKFAQSISIEISVIDREADCFLKMLNGTTKKAREELETAGLTGEERGTIDDICEEIDRQKHRLEDSLKS